MPLAVALAPPSPALPLTKVTAMPPQEKMGSLLTADPAFPTSHWALADRIGALTHKDTPIQDQDGNYFNKFHKVKHKGNTEENVSNGKNKEEERPSRKP